MDRDNQATLDKAEPGEPMFIILGRDPDGGNIVRLWGQRRIAAGDTEHGERALVIADAMDIYHKEMGYKPSTAPAEDSYPPFPDGSYAQFGKVIFEKLVEAFVEGHWEIEVNDLITKDAVKAGLVIKTKYDPEIHTNGEDCEPGDDYYVRADRQLP